MSNKDFEYQQVGLDDQGNPLYQKVYRSRLPEKEVSNHRKPPSIQLQINSKQRKDSSRRNTDFLYQDIDLELVKLRHDQSQEHFPSIRFFEKEFVLKVIYRHPIGIVLIWLAAAVIALLLGVVWILLIFNNKNMINLPVDTPNMINTSTIIMSLMLAIIAVFAAVFTRVYRANRLIITTERVVQFISNGLFDIKNQTIDLAWIEDVSYHQRGFIATLINYGSVRLSTVGDESTYYFIFAPHPSETVNQLNDIVFAVKNEYSLSKHFIN